MDASSIYSQTLSQLDETELSLTSVEGDALIQAASPAEHQEAVRTLLKVHQARIALGNATLQTIADRLKANESALIAGTTAVNAALDGLNDLTRILNTVSSLVGVVAHIVPMV